MGSKISILFHCNMHQVQLNPYLFHSRQNVQKRLKNNYFLLKTPFFFLIFCKIFNHVYRIHGHLRQDNLPWRPGGREARAERRLRPDKDPGHQRGHSRGQRPQPPILPLSILINKAHPILINPVLSSSKHFLLSSNPAHLQTARRCHLQHPASADSPANIDPSMFQVMRSSPSTARCSRGWPTARPSPCSRTSDTAPSPSTSPGDSTPSSRPLERGDGYEREVLIESGLGL